MNNPLKGEVGFEVDGASYTLAFSINALCALEDRLDMSVTQIGERMQDGMRMSFLRTVFWAGLTDHHAEMTEVGAGQIMSAIGAEAAGKLIADAFKKAFPKAEVATGAARPRRAPVAPK